MIGLLVSILLFWIIWRMLRPSLPVYVEPPPPPLQIVIHIHCAQVLVQTRDR